MGIQKEDKECASERESKMNIRKEGKEHLKWASEGSRWLQAKAQLLTRRRQLVNQPIRKANLGVI